MAPRWGRSPRDARGMQASADLMAWGGQLPLSSVSGEGLALLALPGMQVAPGIERKCDFPLRSEVSQPPRPGPSILDREPKQAQGEGLGPAQRPGGPRHLMAPHFHSCMGGRWATARGNRMLREETLKSTFCCLGAWAGHQQGLPTVS